MRKDVSGAIENKAKEQKDEFLSLLLGTLGAVLLNGLFELVEEHLDPVKVFNMASSLNYF